MLNSINRFLPKLGSNKRLKASLSLDTYVRLAAHAVIFPPRFYFVNGSERCRHGAETRGHFIQLAVRKAGVAVLAVG